MIDIKVKIHDRFSIEFKVGFVVRRGPELGLEPRAAMRVSRLWRKLWPKPGSQDNNDFAINTWIFLPNSLDINPMTYDKQSFYRDVKSHVRFITPRFALGEIAGGQAVPLERLRKATNAGCGYPSRENVQEYEYQVKMFAAIFNSSHRAAVERVAAGEYALGDYATHVRSILDEYRKLCPTQSACMDYYLFGDEFLTNATLLGAYDLVGKFGEQRELTDLIAECQAHKKSRGFLGVDPADGANNSELIFRHGVLRRYVESDLFLISRRKKDGQIVEQLLYSIAAGISMVFATAVAFWGQLRFGSVATPFFFALVISYMLKDRIKEVLRFYFAHSLGRRYFDNKTRIGIKDAEIGWIKEAVDFVGEEKVPPRVMELRSRSSLLEAENRTMDEKILLYRKLVHIDQMELDNNNEYLIAGINDIMRLHFTRFVEKTDNPFVPLPLLTPEGRLTTIEGAKEYRINIVLQMRFEGQTAYKRYRILFNRAGITNIEELH